MDKDTEQDVAVKIISPRLAGDPAMLSSLRREVGTARKLGSHPNLLQILDIHLRDNPPFITMEIAHGGDLQEYWLAHSRRLPVDHVTRLLKQVLEGLDALHRCRVVHQDIKPQNILLARDGHPHHIPGDVRSPSPSTHRPQGPQNESLGLLLSRIAPR